MDLLEFQGKQLFASFGIPVSDGRAVDSVAEKAEGDASAVKVTPLTEAPPTEISPAVETPPVYKAPHLNNRQPLLSEVSRELGNEMGRRCKKA